MIRLATNMVISNVWLLEHGACSYLVDTGYGLERLQLKRMLWSWGIRDKGDLTAVILTHRHSDHAGNAAWLRRTFDAPVVCHEADADVLSGKAPRARLCGVAKQRLHEGLLSRFEDRYPARVTIDETLSEGRWRKDFKIVHVPGHTEGSILVQHLPTETLFSGDAILAGLVPLRLIESLSLAVPGFSLAVEECRNKARAFVRAIDEIERVSTLCAGHGPLVTKDATEKLRRLL